MFVYILRSLVDSKKHYVGITDDVKKRVAEHNTGENFSTKDFKPWKVICSMWFENPDAAERFERYLKSGSGRAFSKRHFY